MVKGTKACAGCVYQGKAGDYLVCDYLSMTGHRRPCPFGAGCTVKETGEIMKNWDKARAVVLYEYGATDKEIAAEVGVNPITIYRWRAKNGLAAHGLTNPAPVADAVPAPKLPPPEPPEAEAVKDPDGSGPPGTEQDSSGHNGPGADGSGPPGTEQDSSGHNGPGADGSGPMELYLELCGGWVRLRAPDWQTGQRLCDMITELVGRVGAMGWPHE